MTQFTFHHIVPEAQVSQEDPHEQCHLRKIWIWMDEETDMVATLFKNVDQVKAPENLVSSDMIYPVFVAANPTDNTLSK